MASHKLLLLLAPALVAAKAVNPRELMPRDCTSNNCVRAIRAYSFQGRNGTADCSAYLLQTVTPAASTTTVTVSESFTATTTSTSVVIVAVPFTATETTVETPYATVTPTTTSTAVITVAKRQATAGSTQIPAYASACTSFARYSSACSCLSATLRYITAPTPISTVTVTVSPTSTDIRPETVSSTSTTTVSTATETSTAATATATAPAIVIPSPFRLMATNPANAGQYVTANKRGEFWYYFAFTTDASRAWVFTMSDTTIFSVTHQNRPLRLALNSATHIFTYQGPLDSSPVAVASVDSNLKLTFKHNLGTDVMVCGAQSEIFMYYLCGTQPVSLKLVPA